MNTMEPTSEPNVNKTIIEENKINETQQSNDLFTGIYVRERTFPLCDTEQARVPVHTTDKHYS